MTGETTGVLTGALTELDATGPDPRIDDPLSGFSMPGQTLWGSGIAGIIEVPAPWNENLEVVSRELGRITLASGAHTSGATAFAALPFDPTEAARFVIPRTLWKRDHGQLLHEVRDHRSCSRLHDSEPGWDR